MGGGAGVASRLNDGVALRVGRSSWPFFYFQAGDGIRVRCVTGIQTCALPISSRRRHTRSLCDWSSDVCSSDLLFPYTTLFCLRSEEHTSELQSHSDLVCRLLLEIGRASCRER